MKNKTEQRRFQGLVFGRTEAALGPCIWESRGGSRVLYVPIWEKRGDFKALYLGE